MGYSTSIALPLALGPCSRGGIPEAAVLTVNKDRTETKLLPLDGGGPLNFASRMDMDRVQALSLIVSDLYHFSDRNSVCVSDGKLYGPFG
jgi:hypothetical protein